MQKRTIPNLLIITYFTKFRHPAHQPFALPFWKDLAHVRDSIVADTGLGTVLSQDIEKYAQGSGCQMWTRHTRFTLLSRLEALPLMVCLASAVPSCPVSTNFFCILSD